MITKIKHLILNIETYSNIKFVYLLFFFSPVLFLKDLVYFTSLRHEILVFTYLYDNLLNSLKE